MGVKNETKKPPMWAAAGSFYFHKQSGSAPPSLTGDAGGGNCVVSICVDMRLCKCSVWMKQLSHRGGQMTFISNGVKQLGLS